MKRIALFVLAALALGIGQALAQDSLGVKCVGRAFVGPNSGVEVVGDFAYLPVSQQGMRIYDVSDAGRPHEIGFYYAPGPGFDAAIHEGKAYLTASDTTQGWTALHVIDISDPYHPTGQVQYRVPAIAGRVVISRDYLYWPASDTFRILNISDPNHPRLAGSYLNYGSNDFAASQFYGYLAGWRQLSVLDISNPGEPEILGTIETRGVANSVALNGAFAYVTDANTGLEIIRIGNPHNPISVGFLDVPAHPFRVASLGYHVFVIDAEDGLYVIDAADSSQPHIVGNYMTPRGLTGICVKEDFAYVTDNDSLYILDCSEAMSVQPAGTPVLPNRVTLSPAFPNPFNSRTTVGFTLPRPGMVNFGLFDPMGRQVRRLESSGWFLAGSHQIAFNADGLPSGGYFIQIQTGENVLQQRVTLVR